MTNPAETPTENMTILAGRIAKAGCTIILGMAAALELFCAGYAWSQLLGGNVHWLGGCIGYPILSVLTFGVTYLMYRCEI